VDALLQRLRDTAARASVAEFARQFTAPALALWLPSDDWGGFNTSVRSFQDIITADPDAFDEEGDGGLAVRFVEKSDRNPYADRISLGRAASCDMVVRHPSVSKLHAHFLRADPSGSSGWSVRDANSKNGVEVNKVRVRSTQGVPLRFGDTLKIGILEGRFVDGYGLYTIVRRNAL